MNITGFPLNAVNLNPNSQFSIEMLKQNIDISKDMGKNFIKMIDESKIEEAINPNVGTKFDVKI